MAQAVSSPKIIVTRKLPAAVELELVERYAAALNPWDRQYTPNELSEFMREADVVLCTLTDNLSRKTIENARKGRIKLLANFGVGFNHIDLRAAAEQGIAVTNTPGVLTEDTADLTMLLILAAARRVSEGERELRAGKWAGWRPTHLLGTRVSGKTLGIVGFGRIGQAVAKRAIHGFGMRVLYHSRVGDRDRGQSPISSSAVVFPDLSARSGSDPDQPVAEYRDLDALLRESDFVSLHTPATPDTHNLIDAAALRSMQRHAFLVNTSRGNVVDEDALIVALNEQWIAGAALDVYDKEPKVNRRLLACDNVVLLPHLGSATVESRVAMGQRALANIDALVAGRDLPDRIA
jgi:lactate dehydrogenase-like 2-hydroxyacid dehydrogenase